MNLFISNFRTSFQSKSKNLFTRYLPFLAFQRVILIKLYFYVSKKYVWYVENTISRNLVRPTSSPFVVIELITTIQYDYLNE